MSLCIARYRAAAAFEVEDSILPPELADLEPYKELLFYQNSARLFVMGRDIEMFCKDPPAQTLISKYISGLQQVKQNLEQLKLKVTVALRAIEPQNQSEKSQGFGDVRSRLTTSSQETDNFTEVILGKLNFHLTSENPEWTNRFVDYQRTLLPGNGTTISPSKANELLREVDAMNDIDFHNSGEFCWARAHIVANRLVKKGYPIKKIHIRGGTLSHGWKYHVAIAVDIKRGNEVARKIIDPTFDTAMMTIDEWLKHILPNNKTPIWSPYPAPYDTGVFNQSIVFFSDPKIFMDTSIMPDKISPASEQASLDLADAHK